MLDSLSFESVANSQLQTTLLPDCSLVESARVEHRTRNITLLDGPEKNIWRALFDMKRPECVELKDESPVLR